jgi:hypothetical protein
MTATLANSPKLECWRRLAAAASLAPSAENTQPWRFIADGQRLVICLDKSRTLRSDVDGMLDLTSVGACLENAVVAARHAGFEPRVGYFPEVQGRDDQSELWPAAELALTPGGDDDPLFDVLGDRCTCRRMDGRRPVEQSHLARLAAAASPFENVRLDWIVGRPAMRRLAKLVGLGNRLRFEHEPFHAEFYQNMRFSRDEAQHTRDGLDAATLQLPAGVGGVLRFMRIWRRTRLANIFGYSRVVGRQAYRETLASGALGVLSVDDSSPEAFLDGGRALERVWLTATAHGLGLHPAASVAVFLAYARRTDGTRLLPSHRRMVRHMHEAFDAQAPHLGGRTVQMVFRLGYAERPQVRSLRRDIVDVFESAE